MNFRLHVTILVLGLTTAPLWAGWKDEIGFTRLQSIAGTELPTTLSQGYTQVEVSTTADPVYTFVPDTSNALFNNITFTNKSAITGTAVSTHATHVATNFYSTTSQLPGAAPVDLYELNHWVNAGFLNYGGSAPNTESRAVQNHSWAGSFGNTTVDTYVSRRLDYAIDRDGFVCAVGLYNYDAVKYPNHPQLLCQTYNTITVGRDDGGHTTGLTTLDGSDRMKPDIVAPSASPEYATSWTTPMVSGSAALLYAKLSAAPYSLTGADKPRVIKALLLASATKNTVPGWSNSSTSPLDATYGAGELNIHHAYHTLLAGRASYGTTSYGIRGWAAQSVTGTARNYYFTIPAGAPGTPFCAALTWHRTISSNNWSASTLGNLRLRLHSASGTTLGTAIAESNSSVDNVELIYQSALPPGDYALVVDRASGNTATPYALAWHSLPAVTVAATVSTAREIDGQQGVITLTRTGDTTLPLYVPLTLGGTATAGSHYQALSSSVTIPAGASSATLQIIPVSDQLAQGSRTITVAVAADFALVRDSSQSATVTLEDKPFDTWRFASFTTTELADSTSSSETADPDADQLANLIEYALGLNPKTPNVSPIALIDSSGYQALSATKNPAATDITWAAEISDDLQLWFPADIVTNTSTTFLARDTILTSAAGKRFIRLKVTRP